MKRIIALVMAVVMLLSLSACGGGKVEESADSTTTTTTAEESAETTTTTMMGETDTTTEGEATTTESETTASTEHSADSDGSATTAKPTTEKSSATAKKTTATTKKTTTTTKKPATTATTERKPDKEIVCTGYEIAKVERPNACYIDGKDMLTYFLGENKCFQEGDIITYNLNFSKGSLSNCDIELTASASNIKISGNTITATIKRGANDYNLQPLYISIYYYEDWMGSQGQHVVTIREENILWYEKPLDKVDTAIESMMSIYAKQKYDITLSYDVVIKTEDRYTYKWYIGEANDPSLTKQHGDGKGCDDIFYKKDVEDWILYSKWIIDEYAKMGIKRVKMDVRTNFVLFTASKKG